MRVASLFTILPFLALASIHFSSPEAMTLALYDLTRYPLYLRPTPADMTTLLPPVYLDGTCFGCDNAGMCRCIRRPTAMGNALAVAGMLRVLAVVEDADGAEAISDWGHWGVVEGLGCLWGR